MSELGPANNQPEIPDYAMPAIDTYTRLHGEAPTGETLERILTFLGGERSTATEEELLEFAEGFQQDDL
jgi:hypothetical protein